MRRRAFAARGFTLLEILVVTLVLGIMMMLAYGALRTVIETKDGVQRSFDRTAAFDRTFQRMRQDFLNLRDRPVRDTFGDEQASLLSDREGALSLTRGGWRNPLMVSRGTIERIGYRLDGKKLMRSSYRVLDLATDSKPASATLLEGVEELHWRFLDQDREWQTSWPPQMLGSGAASGPSSSSPMSSSSSAAESSQPPPRAVEITIVTQDWGALKFLFRTGGDATPSQLQTIRQQALATTTVSPGGKTCPPGTPDCTVYPGPGGANNDGGNGDGGNDGGNDGGGEEGGGEGSGEGGGNEGGPNE